MTEKKEQTTNIYKVTDKDCKQRLVEAAGRTKAINHVFSPQVETLKATDVVALMLAGAEVEKAE